MTCYGHVLRALNIRCYTMWWYQKAIFSGRKKKKRRRKSYEGQKIHDFSELKVGDYVVHESHGLGIYRGSKR